MSDTKSMNSDLTKTDRFLNLYMALLSSPKGYITDEEFREILGNPSKSQYHKYINDLIKDKQGRRGSLERKKVNGSYVYRLKESVFNQKPEAIDRPKLVLLSQQNFAELRVYDESRRDMLANNQIAFDLLRQGDDFDLIRCRYENRDDFLHLIFPYADNLEIISPQDLKQAFIKKAQKAAFLNMSTSMESKKKSA